MSLHASAETTDVLTMEASEASVDHMRVDEEALAAAEVDGDHPDPVTLTEPSYDGSGLLRWASLPLPGGLGSGR
jgi:hypothetical protein